MTAWESQLSTSQATNGYLSLRLFELIASLAVVLGANLGDVIGQGLVLVVLHAESKRPYNSATLLLPDLNSLKKESSSRRRARVVPGVSMRSLREELPPPMRNWLKRDAKLIIF